MEEALPLGFIILLLCIVCGAVAVAIGIYVLKQRRLQRDVYKRQKQSWNRTFTAYEDYESTRLLTEVEGELIPQIVDKLVTDIFQASSSNW